MRSIVGRFLEHSRIFHFANGGDDEIYLGSADWMPRNLFERCEVVFPVRDAAAKARIHDEILPAYLADTRQGAHPAGGRHLSPRRQVGQGRARVLRAGFPDAAGGREGGPGGNPRGGHAGDASAMAKAAS